MFKESPSNNKELQTMLNCWTREQCIEWLCWNDKNGCYSDSQSIQEFGKIMSKKEATEIILNQYWG